MLAIENLKVELEGSVHEESVPTELRVLVFRLVREMLRNVAKHAGPTARARLCVRMVEGAVHWEITDDGGAYGADGGTAGRRRGWR